MDVVAGKNGSFFVVRDNVDTDTLKRLADISFDEFERYNAWLAMKKISRITSAEYAAKKSLRLDILEKFDRFVEAVDYKVTQDLLYFIETESGRSQVADERSTLRIDSNNFKNSFLYPAPREVSGLVTDSFQIKNDDVPRMLKAIGVSIVRSVISHFVKWNNVTYKVDVVPTASSARKNAFGAPEITIGENCYVFQSDDWRHIKKIEHLFNKEKVDCKKSWFKLDKPEEKIFDAVLRKVCKDVKQQASFSALYQKYMEIREQRANYRNIFIHEFHHLRNKILLENRFLKPNVKALNAADMYFILVETERSAHLAATLDRINLYWHDHDWEKLLRDEPCFRVLTSRSEAERNRLLLNLDFVTNAKLKHWTENSLESHYKKFMNRMSWLQSYCSVAKGIDNTRKEYQLMRSMLYSFWVYNPFSQKYKVVRLDKNIKIDIPFDGEVPSSIINRAQYILGKKKAARDMLMLKHGVSSDLIRKAANIYDAQWRIKPV